jgi:hypothetical protein
MMRVLQLVAPTAQVAEGPKAGSELRAHCPFYGVMAAAARRAQALLR